MPPFSIGAPEYLKGVRIAIMMRVRSNKMRMDAIE
jgi:hypothetical protein